jgi:serine-threonine kinase receptor-associated protein
MKGVARVSRVGPYGVIRRSAMQGVGLLPSAPLICPGHSRPVAGIDFSAKTEDGVFLISACHDKTAMIRSGETGDWIGTFEGHKGAVWGAALNAPATRAATASGDFSTKVWDALTGDELLDLKHKHIVRTVDWSPDSSHIVTGGKEAKLRMYDMNQPESEPSILLGHEAGKAIKVVKYLPEQQSLFLSAGDDKTLRLWDVRQKAEAASLSFGGSVNSVELSRDAKTLTIAAGNEVSFWDAQSYQCLKRFKLAVVEANGYGVNSATLHPDRKAFVAGGGNFWVYVHDYETGEELLCNKGHHGPVYGCRFTPDGKTYASAGDDGTIRFWTFAEDSEGGIAASASG